MALDSSTTSELGSAAGIGLSAATGNWLGAAIGAVGLGMQVFGGVGSSSAAAGQAQISQENAALSQDEAQQEQNINIAKQQAMELNARRTNMQNIRNTQIAAATSLNRATAQGAQFGSGEEGAQAGIYDTGLFNITGVNSALQSGRQIGAANSIISNDKIKSAVLGGQSAALGGQAATDAGISSLGGTVLKSGPFIGQVSQGFGKMNFGNAFMGGGSPSGYGT